MQFFLNKMVSLCDINWGNFNKFSKFVKMARVQRVTDWWCLLSPRARYRNSPPKFNIRKSSPLTKNCGNRRPAISWQHPCSNRDQLSASLIQAVLIPSYPPSSAGWIVLCLLCYVVGGVHKMAKPDMSMEPKITCYKIFIFQPILEFQKHFHYTEVNAV
jgi:hypothetical protein